MDQRRGDVRVNLKDVEARNQNESETKGLIEKLLGTIFRLNGRKNSKCAIQEIVSAARC